MSATTVRVPNFLGTGIDLLPLPASPSFRQIDWANVDGISANTSPYTRTKQIQQWPGAEYWAGTFTLPRLTQADAAEWTASMQGTRGITHAFQLGDQSQLGPRNPTANDGVTLTIDTTNPNGANVAGGVLIALQGWTPGTPQVLMRGDYMQWGYRLYRVMGPTDADSNGKVTVAVWPSLRENVDNSMAIDIATPVGIFRRTSNKLVWSVDYNGFTNLSFEVEEVR